MRGRRATLARTWRKRLPPSAAQCFHEPHFGRQTRSTAAWIFAAMPGQAHTGSGFRHDLLTP